MQIRRLLKHGWQGIYQVTLGRLRLRQRLLMMLLLLVMVAVGISFYSEYTIHKQMLETEINDDINIITMLLASSLQFRDGRPFLPYDPRRSPLSGRIFGDEQVRFRIVQLSLDDSSPNDPRVLVQGGGSFPAASTPSVWVRARADTVWHVTSLWLDNQPDELLFTREPTRSFNNTLNSTNATALRLDIALEVSDRYDRLAVYLQRELLVFPIILGVTALLAWWLVQKTLEPLAKLTTATQQLQRQRFPEPLPVTSEHDEIGILTSNFNAMVAEVRGMLERERSFTRYASHELRTPLSTLKAQLEALELDLLPPEQVMPSLQHALSDIEIILAALLQLSRLEKPRLEPLPLRDVIGQLEHQFATNQHVIARDRLQVHTLPDVWLLSHSDLLNQVLANLISNALKYSGDAVDIAACAYDTNVTVSVRDYGGGVPEDLLSKLTTPFFRVQGSRAKGLGLGLALSEHIVRSLEGTLTFANIEGGFVARVTLPLYDEPS